MPSKPVAALNAATFAGSPPAQSPRKLKKRSAPAPSAGNGGDTRYFAGFVGATSVRTSVPMSPNFVETPGTVIALPASPPLRLSYDAWTGSSGAAEVVVHDERVRARARRRPVVQVGRARDVIRQVVGGAARRLARQHVELLPLGEGAHLEEHRHRDREDDDEEQQRHHRLEEREAARTLAGAYWNCAT